MSINLQNGLTTLTTLVASGVQIHPQATNYRRLQTLERNLGEVNGRLERTIAKINSSGHTTSAELDVIKQASSSNVLNETTRMGHNSEHLFVENASRGSASTSVRIEDAGVKVLESEVGHMRGMRANMETEISELKTARFRISPIAKGLSIGGCAMQWKMAYDAGNNGETMAAVTHGASAAGHAMVVLSTMAGERTAETIAAGAAFGKAGMVLALSAGVLAMAFDGHKN